MAGTEVLIVARVLYAQQLPKADRFSESDPYVRVVVGNASGRTRTRSNDAFPFWGDLVAVPVVVDLAAPQGSIRFEVWDDDLGPDDLLGSAEIDIADLVKAKRLDRTMKLTVPAELKSSGEPTLHALLSFVRDYSSLKKALGEVDGMLADDRDRELMFPVKQLGDNVYMDVEYDKRDLDVELLVTGKESGYHYAVEPTEGGPAVRVKSRRYAPPVEKRHNGQTVLIAQTIEIDDAALDTDFSHLSIVRSKREVLDKKSLAAILGELGGETPMTSTFDELRRIFQPRADVYIDHKDEKIVIPGKDFSIHLELDRRDFEVSLLIHAGTEDSLHYEIEAPKAGPQKRRIKHYASPRQYGPYSFIGRVGLDDIPRSSVSFEDVFVERTRLVEPKRWKFTELLPIELS